MMYKCVTFTEGLTVGAYYPELKRNAQKYHALVINDEGVQQCVLRQAHFICVSPSEHIALHEGKRADKNYHRKMKVISTTARRRRIEELTR